ncbi:MAG: ribonuclease III domain-containing protein [Candidatus Thermoplasmatota archaeon]|jgi:ribonuclease-3|nr:ribonuclease III domain-containing protein [Candidatus Thermoplasmatota archaeon]
MDDKKLEELQEKIEYHFKDKELLKNALTHKTYAFEAKIPVEYNERLELLGDSILSFVVAEQLYKSNKYFTEGELTRRRSILVNNDFLAKKAKQLDLGKYLLLGKGEIKQNGDKNPTNLANALEAIIGSIYLDSGMSNTKKFILKKIYNEQSVF